MNIELMMFQVLDDPTGVRIIVETKYPDFQEMSPDGNAYFMIDRGDCGMSNDKESEVVYDHWKVSDSIGQTKNFNSNVDLIEFLDSIEDIITRAWVESF